MRRRLALLALASSFAALAAPLAAQPWRGPEDLEVRVEDAKGRDVEGAEVVLEYATRELGGPAPMLTDARGRLAVGGLLPGRWALEVRKPGFMSFRAEIALAGGDTPEIVIASQHNVPGATSTMRVRLGRARNAPPAPARVERVTELSAPPAPSAPVAPVPATPPVTAAAPAPAPPAPAAKATPAAEVAPNSPRPEVPAMSPPAPELPAGEASPPVAPPAAPSPPNPAPAPVRAPAAAAVAVPPAAPETTPEAARPAQPEAAPAPAPPASAAAPAPPAPAVPRTADTAPPAAPAARVSAAAPLARACYECRPGESALLAEATTAAGADRCPANLAARLASVPRSGVAALAAGLPGGCAVLAVDLPANGRFVGFRYEAAGVGASADCLPGRECPAGDCRFPIEPVIRDEDGSTWLLAIFESGEARRAGFTVYWRRTR